MGRVIHFFDPESRPGFGGDPALPGPKGPAHPPHLLLSLLTKRSIICMSYKRCSLADVDGLVWVYLTRG